ncbi:uncharacterized protein N7511_000680 [Penicillium nucicola]|uniref:uncharacterized protein n=1 Tax=Penicillium nucicola TaxID=1850975 RepID=UPI0025452358|nr:uncharacterized protein N7511_000680 [Penicillium nucicola]KAJ5775669.1 hypothetical protein N7511_000680 [Penicillium nucicola]
MSASMFNMLYTEEAAPRPSIACGLSDYSIDQMTESGPINVDTLTYSPVNRVRSTLNAFPDTMLLLAPGYLSTGAPRQHVQVWWDCCGCHNMVNPALASEKTCPICAHKNAGCCKNVNVP